MTRAAMFLIIGVVLGVLAGIAIPRGSAKSHPLTSDEMRSISAQVCSELQIERRAPTTTSADASAELALLTTSLGAGQMQDAYDALLAAMRVAPTDERVFERSLEFARAAGKNPDEEVVALAQDVHQRAASLIPFLPTSRLKSARANHDQAAKELYEPQTQDGPADPLAEAEALLDAAQKPSLPSFVRVRLVQEAEDELASQATHVACSTLAPADEENFWKRWRAVRSHHDQAQKDILASLCAEDCGPRLQAWTSKVEEFYKSKANSKLEELHAVNQEILSLVVEGQRISRDLAPYIEGGVRQDNKERGPDWHLTRLALLREWNYNRWALDRIDKVEQGGGGNLEKLKGLANIDESRLAPFAAQRHGEVWNKFFDECSRDDKVEATRLRILREYQ